MVAKKKRVKAGTSKAAAAARKIKFIQAYISNGGNATQAALTAGFAKSSAYARGGELVKDSEIISAIADAAKKAAAITGLDTERTLREIARLAYSDPRRLYKADGTIIPIHELDDDAAATIASVEVDEFKGEDAGSGRTVKVKVWDKNSALEKAARFHGLYEKDNRQQGEAAIRALMEAVGLGDGKFEVNPKV